tara:strand:+ start:5454 stop:5627 length:174 start_codon:yes stop_codon:yes gene_type:complete
MKLCPHMDRDCSHSIPWVNGFYGCNNVKRELLDVEWCGKTKEECKGKLDKGSNIKKV